MILGKFDCYEFVLSSKVLQHEKVKILVQYFIVFYTVRGDEN